MRRKEITMTQIEKDNKILECGDSYDEILDIQYGEPGSESRNEFDSEVEAFILAEKLKEERLRAGLTQGQLAKKVGVGRTSISNIERGNSRVSFDIVLRAFRGVGHRISFAVL